MLWTLSYLSVYTWTHSAKHVMRSCSTAHPIVHRQSSLVAQTSDGEGLSDHCIWRLRRREEVQSHREVNVAQLSWEMEVRSLDS